MNTQLVDKIILKEPAAFRQRPARKQFFFEKKNQKTFDYVEPNGGLRNRPQARRRPPTNKSFLVLFFKKELLPSRLLSFAGCTLHFDLANNVACALREISDQIGKYR